MNINVELRKESYHNGAWIITNDKTTKDILFYKAQTDTATLKRKKVAYIPFILKNKQVFVYTKEERNYPKLNNKYNSPPYYAKYLDSTDIDFKTGLIKNSLYTDLATDHLFYRFVYDPYIFRKYKMNVYPPIKYKNRPVIIEYKKGDIDDVI